MVAARWDTSMTLVLAIVMLAFNITAFAMGAGTVIGVICTAVADFIAAGRRGARRRHETELAAFNFDAAKASEARYNVEQGPHR